MLRNLINNRSLVYPFAAVILAGLGIRLWLAWQPIETLLDYSVCDDMFYYLKLAHHFASGAGVTFDGLTRTNGFHPLYFLWCAGLSLLPWSQELLVHVILSSSVLWSLLTAGLLAFLVHRLTGQWFLALLAYTVYAFNPYLISQDLNGLETALYGFCLMLTVVVYLELRNKPATGLWAWAGLGGLVGLTLMARTESIFLPLVIALDALGLWLKGNVNDRRWWGYVLAGAITTVSVAPWAIWNWVHFHSLVQDSARVFPYRAQILFAEALGRVPTVWDYTLESLRALAWNVYILLNMLAGIPYTAPKNIMVLFLVIPVGLAGFFLGRSAWIGGERLQRVRALGFFALYIFCLLLYYSVYHRLYHWRYLYSMHLFFIPLVFGLLNAFQIESWLHPRKRLWVILGVALYLLASSSVVILKYKAFPGQRPMYAMALWMRDHLPPAARVGSAGAGIYGYWSKRQVVNLDGVVNTEIFPVIRQRQLWAYIQKMNIEYLCDNEDYITEWHQHFSSDFTRDRLRLVHTIQDQNHLGLTQISLYQIVAPQPGKE